MFAGCRRRTSEGTTTRSSPRRTRRHSRRSRPGDRPGDRERRRTDPGGDVPRQSRLPASSRGRDVPAQNSDDRRTAFGGHAKDHRARRRARTGDVAPPAGRAAGDPTQPARDGARQRHDRQGRRPDRTERELVYELAKPVHRRGRRRDRAGAAAWLRALVVRDRADPEDRLPARSDCRWGLLGSRGRHEPRRARRARSQRQPDERRAPASLQGARDRQPAQVRLPRQHVARAPHAAERDHRLLPGAARRALRRDQREAEGVSRGHPLVRQPPAVAHQRHPRPVEGRGGAGRASDRPVLVARRAGARRGDGARTCPRARRPGGLRLERRRRRRDR